MSIESVEKKFAEGILRWHEAGFSVPDALLRALVISPAIDLYDGNFRNELTCNLDSPEDVAAVLGIKLDAFTSHHNIEYSYQIKELNKFVQAAAYRDYCPTWCIVNSEEAFHVHSSDGQRFFVALRDDYTGLSPVPDNNMPYDDYGYSIIGIGVNNGSIVSVTSRWNSQSEADNFLSLAELKNLLGDMLDNILSLLP